MADKNVHMLAVAVCTRMAKKNIQFVVEIPLLLGLWALTR